MVRKLIKMKIFTVKVYYIASLDHPNVSHTKNHIWVSLQRFVFGFGR